jgi:hypothetical protein
MTVPYSSASSGIRAREEITKVLRRFGAEEIGFLDKYNDQMVLLHFVHRGRRVQMPASARGWATLWLKENPWSSRMRHSEVEHHQKALQQGMVATNSMLRDWLKGQIVALETGLLSFEELFLPFMLTSSGQTVIERVRANSELLPPRRDN